ncbi:MAG: DUF2135 domain-containing protein [Betaproteobacteria bacterium]|nr:DUF2135 domain-containing protein [Betaproteobacteria bacterium]
MTRARIDPALLEATQGNNYKVRVYPILPGKHKRVIIRYAESLAANGGHHRYRLPLGYAETLASFGLTITVADAPAKTVRGARALGELAFMRTGTFYTARVERRQFAARGMLELAIPASTRPQLYTQTVDGRTYFYAEVPVTAASAARPLPKTVGVLWDSSGSGASRDHAREFALLDAYFQKLRDAEVRLVRLRNTAEPVETFNVKAGDWRALRRALETTVYDGATRLDAFSAVTHGGGAGEYLLFSDGLANFGSGAFPETRVPVYAISAALRSDPARLRHIAHASGGRHIELLTHGERIVSLTAQGATQLIAASPYPENGRLRVAGVLSDATAAVQIETGMPGHRPRSFRLEAKPGLSESPYAAFMWASLRVAELEADHRLNRADIQRVGKAFGVVTRETSLIVLDRVEDYARYEITPPPELRAEYERLLATARQRRARDRQAQIERVAKLFADRQAWWARDFPKDDRPAQIAAPKAAVPAAPRVMPLMDPRRPAREARRESAPSAAMAPMLSAQGVTADRAGRVSGAEEASTPSAAIRLRPWRPDAPYIERLAKAAPAELYRVYLDERPSYAASSAFYLDAADQLFDKGMPELALHVLSNLAEMDLENRHILRILGHRLLQAGKPQLAIPVFEQVLELAPAEPQSYRDLGLAHAADKQYQKAVNALYEVVIRPWHGRFPEIELIALAELNAIVAEAERAGVTLDVSHVDPRFLKNLPLDLRVVLTWDADNTDIDLWVTDPNGEKAYYGHRLTYQGGRMSPDFTGGYGPEEFSLRNAKPGKYVVQVNFYGHQRQVVAGATTLQVRFITGFGTPRAQERIVTLRLRERREMVTVGEFEVDAGNAR